MRTSALFPATQAADLPGANLHRLTIGKVMDLNRAAGTVFVQLGEGNEPHEALVMVPKGNASSGWVWLPQVDDLVVCAFLDGFKDTPIVLGCVYDFRDVLPSAAADQLTVKHQSGSSLAVDADGTMHVTHKGGSALKLDQNEVNLDHKGTNVKVATNGDVTVTHPTGQKVHLYDDKAELESGTSKATVDASAGITLNANGAKIEISPNGSIVVTPGSGIINLGGPGVSEAVIHGGDITSSPIGGGVADHYHIILGSSTTVYAK